LACLGFRSGSEQPVAASVGAGVAVYVTPFATRQVSFSFVSQWAGAQDSVYQLAGSTRGGLPARPVFHVPTSDLAKGRVEGRSAAEPADEWFLSMLPGDGTDVCREDSTLGFDSQPAQPQVISVFRTAGQWVTRFDTLRAANSTLNVNGFF